jgi:predicted transcriptional regulator
MRNDKHLAIKLRKKGKSYKKIGAELGIPKSTLSGWLSGLQWTYTIKDELTRKANYIAKKRLRLINKKRSEEWEQWRENFRKRARKQFPHLLKDPLFTIGVSFYWGERNH